MNIRFNIADVAYDITFPRDVTVDPAIRHFVSSQEAKIEKKVIVSIENELPVLEGRIIHQSNRIVIFQDDNYEYRLFIHMMTHYPYALCKEDGDTLYVTILEGYFRNEIYNDFIELLALEKYLLELDSFVLHSSSILHDGKMILFSAPSGTGKSTQASLWEKYENCEIINGDRNIVSLIDGKWYIRSLPFCGSSGINKHIYAPLQAIVVLKQDAMNYVTPLNLSTRFKRILAETTVNNWDMESLNKVIELIQKLATEIEICQLGCTISQDAVECLKNYLGG